MLPIFKGLIKMWYWNSYYYYYFHNLFNPYLCIVYIYILVIFHLICVFSQSIKMLIIWKQLIVFYFFIDGAVFVNTTTWFMSITQNFSFLFFPSDVKRHLSERIKQYNLSLIFLFWYHILYIAYVYRLNVMNINT